MLKQRLLMAASQSSPVGSHGIFSWGSNASGGTGQNTTSGYTTTPALISGTNAVWTEMSSAQYGINPFSSGAGMGTVAIKSNGTLWSWGANVASGAIAQGAVATDILVPTQVGSATNWSHVAQGSFGGLGVRSDGTLWSWGFDDNGQLGHGGSGVYNTPTQVGSGTNWAKVFTNANSVTFLIDTSGALWTMGTPTGYENGLGNPGVLVSTPTQVGSATNWVQIATTGDIQRGSILPFTIGLQSNGTLWSVGFNVNGQTGRGLTTGSTTSFTQIGSGTTWSYIAALSNWNVGSSNTTNYGTGLAVQTNGTLWGWGASPTNGQSAANTSPTQIGSATTWSKVAGACTGGNGTGGTQYNGYALGLQTNGTIWSWGDNTNYQAGQGSSTISNTPTQIGTGTNWTGICAAGTNQTSGTPTNNGGGGFAIF